jgi:hypothetical protein
VLTASDSKASVGGAALVNASAGVQEV